MKQNMLSKEAFALCTDGYALYDQETKIERVVNGDEVTVEVNCSELWIRFYVNGKKYKKIRDFMTNGNELLRFACGTEGKGAQWTIVD